MNKMLYLAAGLAVGMAVAIPFGISAQDFRALGPGFYTIAVGQDGTFAWRVNTANGTVSVCRAAIEPAAASPACSPWSSTILKLPKR